MSRMCLRRLMVITPHQFHKPLDASRFGVKATLLHSRTSQLSCTQLFANQTSSSSRKQNKTDEKQNKTDKKQNKTDNEGSPKKIQAIPSQLTKLISDTKQEGWPSLSNIALLGQRCALAGVTADQVEEFLVNHYRRQSKGGKQQGSNKETNFYSRHLFNRWQEGNKDASLNKFLEYFVSNIFHQDYKQKLPMKRAEYCLALWRLVVIWEECVGSKNDTNLVKIEKFATEMLNKDPNLETLMHLTNLVFSPTEDEGRNTQSRYLITHLTRVSPNMVKSSTPGLPNLLLLSSNQSLAVDRMLKTELTSTDRIRLLVAKSSLCWRQKEFSSSLESLSSATEMFLTQVRKLADVGELESLDQLLQSTALPVVDCWQEVGQRAPAGPARDYLLALTELFSKQFPGPLGLVPPYILWLAAKEVKSELEGILETVVKSEDRLRGEKFERCFLVKGMTEETKRFFVTDFVRRLALDATSSVGSSLPTSVPAPVETPVVETSSHPSVPAEAGDITDQLLDTGNISEQLLDITILELVSNKKLTEVMDLVLSENRKGQLPSMTVIEALSQLLMDEGDLTNLDILHRSLPPSCQQRELTYMGLGRVRLSRISKGWEKGKKLVSWVRLVELYRSTCVEQSCGEIPLQTGEKVLSSAARHIKLCVEETVMLESEDTQFQDLMKAIKVGVIRVMTEHGDPEPLLILWEALFFAPTWDRKQEADSLLQEFPALVPVLKIDQVLARAARYKAEDSYRRLIEICLKYDTPAYTKSRVFEDLLALQTRSYNISGGNQTIRTAKSLDIRITADYLQAYIDVKKEMELTTNFVSRLKKYFSKT